MPFVSCGLAGGNRLAGASCSSHVLQARPVQHGHLYRQSFVRRRFTAVCFKENDDVGKRVDLKEKTTGASAQQDQAAGAPQGSKLQGACYAVLGGLEAAMAAGALCIPARTAELVLGVALDATSTTVMRSFGAMLLVPAAVNFSLQSASIRDRMSAEVHKRLNAGLTGWAAGVLLVLLQAISVQNAALTASLGVGVVGGGTLLLSSTAYAISKGGLPLPNPKNLIFGVASLFLPRTLSSAAYSLLSVLLGIKAVMLFGTFPGAASPLFSAMNSEVTTLLFRLSGASALLAAVAAFCLRDAAEQHRLDMPTSRMLNLGLATMALAQAAVLAAGVHSGVVLAGPMLNVMLGTCLCACVWCASKYGA